jgi:uncharacterized protein YlzI (FlbEa/FlbD family)
MSELPDKQWALIHKLNGQLIVTLNDLLIRKIRWSPDEWIITVLVLQRTIEETEEAVLKTSSTMLNGKIFDAKEECDLDEGVGDLNRIVPLVKSFAGYCVRSGNVLWVDDIENHPLHDEYRLYEYVNIRPGKKFLAEYVFPIRVKVGVNQTILGVLNAETSREGTNKFKEAGSHRISEIVLGILDAHGPFLLVSQAAMLSDKAAKSLLKAHSKVLESTAYDLSKK